MYKIRICLEKSMGAQRHWNFHWVHKNIGDGIQALPDSFFILISPPFLCSGLPFYKSYYKYKLRKKPIKKFKNYKWSNSSPGPLRGFLCGVDKGLEGLDGHIWLVISRRRLFWFSETTGHLYRGGCRWQPAVGTSHNTKNSINSVNSAEVEYCRLG